MSNISRDVYMEFVSTKTYCHSVGLSCAFRQWRADSHCKYLHGYALQIKLTFQSNVLDNRNWVVDFGSLKSLKGLLEDQFDHKTLVALDDPELEKFKELDKLGIIQMRTVDACGCEAMAYYVYHMTNQWLTDAGYDAVVLESVEVAEHESNSAIYRKKRK